MNVSPSLSSSRDPADSDSSTSGSVHPLTPELTPELTPKLTPKETTHWLLDGYNVLHAALLPGEIRSQTPWWNEEGRQRLIRRVFFFDALRDARTDTRRDDIRGVSGHEDAHTLEDATTQSSPIIWIVFDGDRPIPESEDQHPLVRVLFAPSADDYLVSRSRRADPITYGDGNCQRTVGPLSFHDRSHCAP